MRRVLLAATTALVVLAAAAAPAPGATQETFVVSEHDVITQEYGPIPGNFPFTNAVNWTPTGCDTGAPGGATCDRIPVKIPVPDVADADDYYVEITVDWDDDSDLDVYFWDNGQIREGSSSPGFTRMTSSASADKPEVVKVFEPDLIDYNLTVLNWAGANLGYRVTAEMKIFEFTPPFEALAPEFRDPSGGGTEETFVPYDYSADAPLAAPSVSAPAPPAFGELAITPDRDFSNFGTSDFDDALSAPAAVPAFSPRAGVGPPGDVNAILAIFWLLVVPLVLGGGGAYLLARRSRSLGLAPT